MSLDNQFLCHRLFAFDLRHAEEAIVREELFITQQHDFIAAQARAGQDIILARKGLGTMEHYLASLNEWRQCILDKLDEA